MSIEELKSALAELYREQREISAQVRSAEDAVAQAWADGIGLKIGSVIRVKKSIGYGAMKSIRQTRYRVTRFGLKSYGAIPLKIWARTIRKNGTDGDVHEIYDAFTLETEESQP